MSEKERQGIILAWAPPPPICEDAGMLPKQKEWRLKYEDYNWPDIL